MTSYDFRTGELHGRRICRHGCGMLDDVLPEFAPADFHTAARCVEPVEPVR